MAYTHGGNIWRAVKESGYSENQLLDFSANINPLGPPEWLRPLISSRIESLIHYPDPGSSSLIAAIADHYDISASEIVIGNGSSELINVLPRALKLQRAVIPVPCYSEYISSCELNNADIQKVILHENEGFAFDFVNMEKYLSGGEMVYIGQPNNPTGLAIDPSVLRNLALNHPETIFVIDEAFADFIDNMNTLINNRPANVVVLRSMTKFYAVPGLRLGFAVGDTQIISNMKRYLPAWSVNTLAQSVGEAAIADEEYAAYTRKQVDKWRTILQDKLASLPGIKTYPSSCNFILLKLNRCDINADELYRRLLHEGIMIRNCANYEGLDNSYIRVAVKSEEENNILYNALRSILEGMPITLSGRRSKRRARSIMLQGTSSNAGKSVITAALCRIFLQDGHQTAPFKAQNMSLNSYVTRDGGEMGRAQVVQAQACRIEPDVRMNPVLLKPSSETGSQVIVCGHPVGNMIVSEYMQYQSEAVKEVEQAYDSLADENDILVIEGAGSPGEVNLKKHDIVNMKMARYAESPVLLVGDIDRGGVYASFVGTMEVLAEWERKLVHGFIVNRFRGNPDLLQDAHDYVLKHTGKPVIGVVPYLHNLGLPEEDSVSFKEGAFDDNYSTEDSVDIVMIDLPHISNLTDFDALRIEPDVRLRRVVSSNELRNPDAVVIPGSKNVISDLQYLRNTGLADRINKLAADGKTEIVGICGGFQMLGMKVDDPYGIESSIRSLDGMGLLPISTVLNKIKTLTDVTARHERSGHMVRGYEIHHGITTSDGLSISVRGNDGGAIGFESKSGMLWGSYLHGIFDADEFRRWFIDRLRVRKGLAPKCEVCAAYDIDDALDHLAEAVRQSLQMDDIYKLMGLQ